MFRLSFVCDAIPGNPFETIVGFFDKVDTRGYMRTRSHLIRHFRYALPIR